VLRAAQHFIVTALVLDRLRKEVTAAAWPSGPFAKPDVLTALFEVLAHVTDFGATALMQHEELHLSVLSYYRVLLLKEKVRRVSPPRQPCRACH
jgi:hypothetical protein